MLSQAGGPLLDEVMHAFYFAYYPLIIGGIVIAWTGRVRGGETPADGFHTAFTCMLLGFFLSYVWYPFLPARGPWENAQVMADLRPFGGWVFTRIIGVIIDGAAVSGGCFPSAHVSGTWALTFGLYASASQAGVLLWSCGRRAQRGVRVHALPSRCRRARRDYRRGDCRGDWPLLTRNVRNA